MKRFGSKNVGNMMINDQYGKVLSVDFFVCKTNPLSQGFQDFSQVGQNDV